jgi:hypothetical protein
VHNLVNKDGIKSEPIVADLCKKARKVCKTVRYRAPDLERARTKEHELDWLSSVLDADDHADADDADPIPDDCESDVADGEVGSTEANNISYPSASTPTTVKLPVPTRWHTVLIMLESIEQNKVRLLLAKCNRFY